MGRTRHLKQISAALIVLALAACRRTPPPPESKVPTLKGPDGREYVLLGTGPNKPVYAGNALERIEYDRNGDGKPDQVARHNGQRVPAFVEDDDDFDGKTEKWNYYDPNGQLVKVGQSRKGADKPDIWTYYDAQARAVRAEFDDDGDGKVERAQTLQDGQIQRVEVDADRDGRMDRWQDWATGRLTSEELDTDGDGKPDRRLKYGEKGQVVGLEPLAK